MSININNTNWCDLIFKDRNQNYGAYHLRTSSSGEHLRALLIVSFLIVLIVIIHFTYQKLSYNTMRTTNYLTISSNISELTDISSEYPAPASPNTNGNDKLTLLNKKKDIVFYDSTIPSSTEATSTEQKEEDNLHKNETADQYGYDNNTGSTGENLNGGEFYPVEFNATFPGGLNEFSIYISSNLRYPELAKSENIQGLVIIQFTITKEGDVRFDRIVKSLHYLCDQEAIRLIQEMPRWTPARQNGKPVDQSYSLPIMFELKEL